MDKNKQEEFVFIYSTENQIVGETGQRCKYETSYRKSKDTIYKVNKEMNKLWKFYGESDEQMLVIIEKLCLKLTMK